MSRRRRAGKRGNVSGPPLDLEGYAAQFEDPESPDLRLLQQVIPMLNQLSVQAVKIPFAALGAQELAVLFLQVLPQALPPQYIQALLTPDALNALSRFLPLASGPGQQR